MATASKQVYEIDGYKVKTTSLSKAKKLAAELKTEGVARPKTKTSSSSSSSSSSSPKPKTNSPAIVPYEQALRNLETGGLKGAQLDSAKSGLKSYYDRMGGTSGGSTGGSNNSPDLIINSDQSQDFDDRSAADEPDLRSSTDRTIDTLVDGLTRLKAPTPYKAEKTFEDLRDEYGIDKMEEDLTGLQDEERAISAQKRQRVAIQRDKPVTMGVMEGRVGEVERQENERLDAVGREITYKSQQLETKYNVINTLMELKQTDYQNAYTQYKDQFDRGVSMINIFEARAEREETRADRERTNARADLQILWEAAKTSGKGFAMLPESQKMLMAKLDAQAKLPAGFSEFVTNNLPDDRDVIATVQSEDGSAVSFVMRDKKGAITTQVVQTGVITDTKDLTTEEKKDADWDAARTFIEDNKDASPASIKAALREQTGLGIEDINALMEEAGIQEGSGFSDTQIRSIAIQLVKKKGNVDDAKALVAKGSITSGGKEYKLSQQEKEAINSVIDEEYPKGRTRSQAFWPGGK